MFSFSASSVDSHPPSSEMWPLRCAGGSRGGAWDGFMCRQRRSRGRRGDGYTRPMPPPVGHCVGRGWERVWGGSRTGPPRIRPLSALTPRPCTAPSLSIPLSLICQRNGEERVISAPAPSRPRAAPPGRWQHGIAFCVTRPGPPPAPFGAVDESQIRGGGTSFTSERVRGGRRLRGWREGGWSCVFGEQNKDRELLCAAPLSPDVTHSCRGVQH